jgi:hypothetical protein
MKSQTSAGRLRRLRSFDVVFVFVFVFLAIFGLIVVPAAGQGGLVCSAPCPTSNKANNTFLLPLPNGESYTSFYTWITGVFGKESTPVSRRWIDQNTTSPNIHFNDPRPQALCHINVTFVNEYGGFRSRVGSFEFVRKAPMGRRVINGTLRTVFEDATSNTIPDDAGPCLPYGSTVTLGPFAPNASVGFYLDQNAICSGNPLRLWSLDDENAKYNTANWAVLPKAYNRTIAVLKV